MTMRLVYASDLHGRDSYYEELARLAKIHRPDALILGGDLLPRSGSSEATLSAEKRFASDFLNPWIARLAGEGVPILAIPGNDDLAAAIAGLDNADHFHWLDRDGVLLQNRIRIFGYPYVPPTPFSPKDYEKKDNRTDGIRGSGKHPFITESGIIESIDFADLLEKRSSIEEDLQAIPFDEAEMEILVSHAPPFGTTLDRLGDQTPVGSVAILEWIKRRQPVLSLHGHIHESPEAAGRYWQQIGKTVSVNPGQNARRLSAVSITLEEKSIHLEHTIYPPAKITLPQKENHP